VIERLITWINTMPKRRHEDDEDVRPRRPRKRQRSNAPLFIILVVLLLAGVGATVYFFARGKGKNEAKITLANFEKVKAGMTAGEVKELLGPGESADVKDLQAEVARASKNQIAGGVEAGWAQLSGAGRWQVWRGKDLTVFVGYGQGSSGTERVAYSLAVKKVGDGYQVVKGAETMAGNADLDQLGTRAKQESTLLDDPKWKTGGTGVSLLPGEWRDAGGNVRLFRADGTFEHQSSLGPLSGDKGTWRVNESGKLELTSSERHMMGNPNQPFVKITYTWRIAPDELVMLMDVPGGGRIGEPSPLYRVRPDGSGPLKEKVVDALAAKLKDPKPNERQYAAYRLAQLGPAAASAAKALAGVLNDPDPTVGSTACTALGKIGSPAAPAAVPALRQILRDAKSKNHVSACMALAMMGPAARDALPDLKALAERPSVSGQIVNEARGAIRSIEK
jgi:hypothetical protein